MLSFEPITLYHKPLFDNALRGNDIPSCDYSFATIFSWQQHYQSTVCPAADGLLLRFIGSDGRPCYAPPIGCTDDALALKLLIDDARQRGDTFRIGAATQQLFVRLERATQHYLRLELSRDQAEYIYDRQSLATLSGTHLQPKRNFVNRFVRRFPNYHAEPIADNNIDHCLEVYDAWLAHRPSELLADEHASIVAAFNNFDALQLRGLVLYADNRPVAFAFGEMLTADTFLTHAEKALRDIEGSYAMINKLTAELIAKPAKFINREEDMGDAGLRKSKLSYNPIRLLEKGVIYLDK